MGFKGMVASLVSSGLGTLLLLMVGRRSSAYWSTAGFGMLDLGSGVVTLDEVPAAVLKKPKKAFIHQYIASRNTIYASYN